MILNYENTLNGGTMKQNAIINSVFAFFGLTNRKSVDENDLLKKILKDMVKDKLILQNQQEYRINT